MFFDWVWLKEKISQKNFPAEHRGDLIGILSEKMSEYRNFVFRILLESVRKICVGKFVLEIFLVRNKPGSSYPPQNDPLQMFDNAMVQSLPHGGATVRDEAHPMYPLHTSKKQDEVMDSLSIHKVIIIQSFLYFIQLCLCLCQDFFIKKFHLLFGVMVFQVWVQYSSPIVGRQQTLLDIFSTVHR